LWQVTPTGSQSSGVLSSMSEANCFIVLGHDEADIAEGEHVDIMLFDGLI
ncbi:MAG: molybdopterin molybdenumtransferase MoeA, partial [Paraburkholderia sp.]